ncbi:MAG TPA: xanthine dehydrogenase family protein subunit M [Actinomycetota bacterium]|jgi:carbon-monoxide dehydrogenase medium subunit|nr:xanthine dehydrogenase family protein subunit M [Actinomycetota bacterium]
MFPSAFEYTAADSLDQALAVLAERGDEAKVLAGGQSLIPLLKLRFAAPAMLLDVNRVPGLNGVSEEGDSVTVGALERHNAVAGSDVLKRTLPLITSAAPQVADPLVRNLGTIGGSLAHADPAGDWGSVMLALNAELVLQSASGERTVAASDFLVDTFTTVLEPTEIVTKIRIPRPRVPSGGIYLKLERKVGDFATVGVAVQLELDDGTIRRAGIGLTAVGSRNIRAAEAEGSLAGAEPTEEAFAQAAELAAQAAEPISDLRGSADYKKGVVRTFVRRGLNQGLAAARGSN